ncbi:MAG: hypothetical protein JST11_01645 [Acidobacteria bacterium]|nr:hypothetical protein [Acidobacteriota bacterium]
MPHTKVPKRKPLVRHPRKKLDRKPEARHTVALPSLVASQVERYAETAGASMSKAIAAFVRFGLQSQADRKREFFKRLKENLGDDDPADQDRLVDEFRALILGR